MAAAFTVQPTKHTALVPAMVSRQLNVKWARAYMHRRCHRPCHAAASDPARRATRREKTDADEFFRLDLRPLLFIFYLLSRASVCRDDSMRLKVADNICVFIQKEMDRKSIVTE